MTDIHTLPEAIAAINQLQAQNAAEDQRLLQLEQLTTTQKAEVQRMLAESKRAQDYALHAYRVDHYGYIWKWDPDAQLYVKTKMRVGMPIIADESITSEKIVEGAVKNRHIGEKEISFGKLNEDLQNRIMSGGGEGGDKPYEPTDFSGLGKTYLYKNIVNVGGVNKNILAQDAFCKDGPHGTRVPNTNTVFVVPFDFEIGSRRELELTISSNVSGVVSPDYTGNQGVLTALQEQLVVLQEELAALEAEKQALIDEGAPQEDIDAVQAQIDSKESKIDTKEAKIADQQTIISNTPQYYYYTEVTIPAHKVLIAQCPGCVFLNNNHSSIIAKDIFYGSTEDDVNTIVAVAYMAMGTYTFVEDSFIELPENSALEFDGGSIDSGTIKGNHTNIIASPDAEIFKKGIIIQGLWDITEVYDGWFEYNHVANHANNQIIKNILGLTHDDFSSNVHIVKDREYLVELPEIPEVLKNGHSELSCRQYNSSAYNPTSTTNYPSNPKQDIRSGIWGWGPGREAIVLFKLNSNTRYIIDSTIKMLPTGEDYYVMFYIFRKENVVIEGSGSLIGDNTGIDNTHLYSEYYNPSTNTYFGEQGFIIRAYATKNLAIKNLTVSGSFGDNIYITGSNFNPETGLYYLGDETQEITPSEKVDLLNLRVLYARRNGVAISCTNALVQGCFFEGNGIGEIKGTAPKAGIDFECDQCSSSLHSGPGGSIMCNRNVTMDGCVFKGNENDISSTSNRAWGEETIETFIKNCAFTSSLRLNSTNGIQFEDCYIPSIEGKPTSTGAELWYLARSEYINFIRCFFEDTNIRMLTYMSSDGKYLVTDSVKFIDCIFKNDFKLEDHAYVYASSSQMAYLRIKAPSQNSDVVINMRLTFSGYVKKQLEDADGYICISSIEYTLRAISTSVRMSKCKRIHVRGSAFSGDKDNDVHLPRVAMKKIDNYIYIFISSPYFKNYGLGVDYTINCCKLTNSASETTFVHFNVNPVVGVFDETEEINKNTVTFANVINDYIPGNYASADGAATLINDARSPFFHNNRLLFPTGDALLGVDGELYNIRKTGTTSQRPTPANTGFKYMDTSLRRPLWWDGEAYMESDGVVAGTKRSGATTSRPIGKHVIAYANPEDPTDTSATQDDTHTIPVYEGTLSSTKDIGFVYFDTTLSKPVYASAIDGSTGVVTWVDATGTSV